MIRTDFSELDVADGTFLSLEATPGTLRVHVKDWREQSVCVEFRDVIGFEANSFGAGDLSHMTEDGADAFLLRAAAIAETDPRAYRCFLFVEADDDRCVLKVAAKGLAIQGRLEQASTCG